VRNNAVGLRHAGWLINRVHEVHPGLHIELCPVTTTYDRQRQGELLIPGRTPGCSEELWAGMREESFDAAWLDLRESMWPLPDDLRLSACLPRRNPRKAFLHRQGVPFAELPPGSRLATTSALCKWQVAQIRPDIVWVTLTGDLPTRLHKLHLQQADGVVESASDLLILGFDEHAIEFLSTDVALPSPGQGVWGICCLRERTDVHKIAEPLEDKKARLCGTTELMFAAALGLPETAAVGAWARAQTKKLMLDACAILSEHAKTKRLSISGPPARNRDLIEALVEMFRQQGIQQMTKSRK